MVAMFTCSIPRYALLRKALRGLASLGLCYVQGVWQGLVG
jgi:hypothetical protein